MCGKELPIESFQKFTYNYTPKSGFKRTSNQRRKKCMKCVNITNTKKYYLKNRDRLLVAMRWVSEYHRKYQKL